LCTAPGFYGPRLRFKSAAKVIEEIRAYVAKGFREVYFRDETFIINNRRDTEVLETIIRDKIDVTWLCNCRVGMVDKGKMQLMKAAGCHLFKTGVESGVQEILDGVKKGIRVEQTRDTFRWAKEVGLETHAHVMLGMPGDTEETILAHVRRTVADPRNITNCEGTSGWGYSGTDYQNQVIKYGKQVYMEINYDTGGRWWGVWADSHAVGDPVFIGGIANDTMFDATAAEDRLYSPASDSTQVAIRNIDTRAYIGAFTPSTPDPTWVKDMAATGGTLHIAGVSAWANEVIAQQQDPVIERLFRVEQIERTSEGELPAFSLALSHIPQGNQPHEVMIFPRAAANEQVTAERQRALFERDVRIRQGRTDHPGPSLFSTQEHVSVLGRPDFFDFVVEMFGKHEKGVWHLFGGHPLDQ